VNEALSGHGRHFMNGISQSPLKRAQAKCEELERELRKCSDFRLYLTSRTPGDQARMEVLLKPLPGFVLWYDLTHSIALARRPQSHVSSASETQGLLHSPKRR